MKIKMLVMDVDGTLTDGKIYFGNEGEVMKAFNVKDGYAIARLGDYDIISCIITGRVSEIVAKRAEDLKVTELHQGVKDKLPLLRKVASKFGLDLSQVAYIGDDLNDLECIEACGLSACPADAVEKIKIAAQYVCKAKAGDGAVREFIEYLK